MMLGESAQITDAALGYKNGFEVDIFGSATIQNVKDLTAQISFGMDNSYRCSVDIWGSTGTLYANRVFTAPAEFRPTAEVKTVEGTRKYELESDDSFANSIRHFVECINDKKTRSRNYSMILKQSQMIDNFRQKSRKTAIKNKR